jgi:8-oxo-dGTP pyrophosphatase MutT (NUDIX family)
MRTRAGIVLIKNNKVALIERFRAGLHYYTFPGGGVDEGESPEQAAVREAQEELGIEVILRQELAEVQLGQKSRQIYFLAVQRGGVFGTGTGEEFSEAHRADPQKGTYIPIWMAIDELPRHGNIYPADLASLVVKSIGEGWPSEPIFTFEKPK